MRNLVYARQCHLQNKLLDTFYYLGVALHYIQDSYTSVISYDSPKNQIWHQNYEQDIEDSKFVYDVENTIQYSFSDDHSQLSKYSAIAKNLSGKVEGKNATLQAATLVGRYASAKTGKPKVDLNLALKASLVVTESVLSSRTCLSLETQLRDTLLQHESFLRNAEIELSNKIIRLIEERDQLISKKVQSTGIVSKIKNWIMGVRISLKNRAAVSTSRHYFSKMHLEDVANDYRATTRKVVVPYAGWYDFQIPQININMVTRHLLPVQEVAKHFKVPENSIRELLKRGNVPSYCVDNRELVRRPELNRVLAQFPLNGFKEYPV